MENNNQPILLLPAPKISRKLLVLNAALLLSILVMTFMVATALHPSSEKKEDAKTSVITVSIEAKAAFVLDVVNNQIIYRKNENARLPLASLTKLMTALTALELVPENSKITIRKEFLREEGDTGLLSGETWKLKDLLDFSLMVSSNDGVRSVASVVGAVNLKSTDYDLGRKEFIAQMNMEADKLGLKQTYFLNESGLDEGNTSGGYGSASDVAHLLAYILKKKPEVLETTKYESLTIDSGNKAHVAKNTNIDVEKIPGLLASKTGYTTLAGGNLVVAFDASIGRPIIVVVLGSSQEGRFKDVQSLVNASIKYVSQ